MMTILLICAATMARPDCQENTAIRIIKGPDAKNEIQCIHQSQQFMAQQKMILPELLKEGRWLKTKCIQTTIGQDHVG